MNIIEDRMAQNNGYEVGSSSILGTRSYQQDFGYFYMGEQEALAVICDGMGGLEGGERASRTAVELIARDFKKKKPAREEMASFLRQEADRMDRAVAALTDDRGKPLKAGTTLVAVYCSRGRLTAVSVGDSRIYLIREQNIITLNREHNYRLMLKEQLAAGQITKEFYEKEEKTPQAEALTSFIGMDGLRIVDIMEDPMPLKQGDIVMLCSDGVYKSLNNSQVLAMVRDNDIDLEIAADRTTAMALRYGVRGQDNTTVILLRYVGTLSHAAAHVS